MKIQEFVEAALKADEDRKLTDEVDNQALEAYRCSACKSDDVEYRTVHIRFNENDPYFTPTRLRRMAKLFKRLATALEAEAA